MTLPPRLTLAAALLLAIAAPRAAEAQASINECEKIQAADAYNQCLAKFGPPAKTGNLEPERPGDVKGSAEEAAAGAGKAKGGRHAGRHRGGGRGAFARRGRGGHVARGGGNRGGKGRQRMTITIGK